MRLKTDAEARAMEFMKRIFGGVVYTFHRTDGFYPISLPSDADALACVSCNPGTLKIVNEMTGDVIYEKETK